MAEYTRTRAIIEAINHIRLDILLFSILFVQHFAFGTRFYFLPPILLQDPYQYDVELTHEGR